MTKPFIPIEEAEALSAKGEIVLPLDYKSNNARFLETLRFTSEQAAMPTVKETVKSLEFTLTPLSTEEQACYMGRTRVTTEDKKGNKKKVSKKSYKIGFPTTISYNGMSKTLALPTLLTGKFKLGSFNEDYAPIPENGQKAKVYGMVNFNDFKKVAVRKANTNKQIPEEKTDA